MTTVSVRSRLDGVPWLRFADWWAMAAAAALPWSTSAAAIFVVLWILALLPALGRTSGPALVEPGPAATLPLIIVGYAVLGVLWSETTWPARFAGLTPFAKLLFIPLVMLHFRRSAAAPKVYLAGFISCCVLLIASWLLVIFPNVPWHIPEPGVPVKDYISQSGFFALCIVALLDRAFTLRQTETRNALVLCLVALIFFANIVFVATGRTTLVVLAVLLVILGARHSRGRMLTLFFAGLAVLAAVTWISSPYLRTRVTNVAAEIHDFRPNQFDTSSGARLAFWRQSLELLREAPLFGHGTGSTRAVMSRASAADPQGYGAPSNPHNQIFAIAIPLGLVGVALLMAMWIAHLRLFRAATPVAWIGLAIVIQNIVAGMFNSHLFDFTQGWLYVIGVGAAGGAVLRQMESRNTPVASEA
jgi:O-antigen ligase